MSEVAPIRVPLDQIRTEDPALGMARGVVGLFQSGERDAAAVAVVALATPGLCQQEAVQDALLGLARAVGPALEAAGYDRLAIVRAAKPHLESAIKALPDVVAANQAEQARVERTFEPIVIECAERLGVDLAQIPVEVADLSGCPPYAGMPEANRLRAHRYGWVVDQLRALLEDTAPTVDDQGAAPTDPDTSPPTPSD